MPTTSRTRHEPTSPTATLSQAPVAAGPGRSARKRQAIMEAATALFLANGYEGTSMDQIAAAATVSKQTVYKNFIDKNQLFGAIVLTAAQTVDEFLTTVAHTLDETTDLDKDLRALARRHVTTVLQPNILQLRRLVIAVAPRFPELARTYHERVPQRVVSTLAASFQRLAERGLLRLDDPLVAAEQFVYLVFSPPTDRAMFHPNDELPDTAALHRHADAAARAFLAAYGTP